MSTLKFRDTVFQQLRMGIRKFSSKGGTRKAPKGSPKLLGAALLGFAGLGGWYAYQENRFRMLGPNSNYGPRLPSKSHQLEPIDDETFEKEDNIMLFVFNGPEHERQMADAIRGTQDTIENLLCKNPASFLKNCKMFFTYIADDAGRKAVPEDEMEVMMYKGQRKGRVTWKPSSNEIVSVESLEAFYEPRSVPPPEFSKDIAVEHISGADFNTKVVQASSPQHPIILQAYETTCFLCFLMRPFINSMARHFRDLQIPLQFKRLNIADNDFPEGMPVCRATPTFIVFTGPDNPPQVLEDFKPKDLMNCIGAMEHVKLRMTEASKLYLSNLLEEVTRRFQMFSELIMWQVKIHQAQEKALTSEERRREKERREQEERVREGLEDDIDGAAAEAAKLAGEEEEQGEEESAEEKALFNATVAEMMESDMLRSDDLPENLEYLEKSLKDIKEDAKIVEEMLGVKIFPELPPEEGDSQRAHSAREEDANRAEEREASSEPQNLQGESQNSSVLKPRLSEVGRI